MFLWWFVFLVCYVMICVNDTATPEIYPYSHSFPTRHSSELCIGRAFERRRWTLGSGAEGDAMSCWENCWESCWRGSARKRQEGQETVQVWPLCSSSARLAGRAPAAAATSSATRRA